MCREGRSTNQARGFSLVELVVSTALAMAVVGAMLQLVHQAYGTFYSEPEIADPTQKARVFIQAIAHDVRAAGGGLPPGVPPVAPFRRGVINADPPESFFADRLSIVYAPVSAARARVIAQANTANHLVVAGQPGCPAVMPLCGFRVDDLAVASDDSGAYDLFRIAAIEPGPPALLVAGTNLSKLYGPGAVVAVVLSSTHWLDVDAATGGGLVRTYDGDRTDVPFLDDVGGLAFEYFSAAGRMDSARFTDGPWLPDAVSASRYDADLLLVRRIRAIVRLRVARRLLAPRPFEAVHFDVALRNAERP